MIFLRINWSNFVHFKQQRQLCICYMLVRMYAPLHTKVTKLHSWTYSSSKTNKQKITIIPTGKNISLSSQVSQPTIYSSPSHHMLLNTIMTNLIKAPVHTKPHSYHHDNRFKTSKQKKKHYTKWKNTSLSLTGLCGNSMTFSQLSVLTNTLQHNGVGRRVAVNPPAHRGTSGWGGYFVKGGFEPPRQIQPWLKQLY